jgi:Big-like domain-containing protein
MMRRCHTIVGLTLLLAGCGTSTPAAPTPPTPAPGSGPSSPNRSPAIVATITPSVGIDQVTTFTARVEVKDPDGDPVAVTLTSLCPFQKDTPVELNGGVGIVSFKPVEKCGPTLSFTATDSKGATARADVSAEHRGLTGSFRLVIGDDFYSEPRYAITLAQSGTLVTGTLSDYPRSGVMDLQTPGSIDENGRFRLRFRVQTDTDEFVLSGELIAAIQISFGDVAIATGQVVSGRHAGRRFKIWVPAYALAPRS